MTLSVVTSVACLNSVMLFRQYCTCFIETRKQPASANAAAAARAGRAPGRAASSSVDSHAIITNKPMAGRYV